MTEELNTSLEKFKCQMYATKSPTDNINDLRYHLFCVKKGNIESHQLPPCRDTFQKHIQRANYQAASWRRCLEQDPSVRSPVGNGWKLEEHDGDSTLVIDWMRGKPAPQALLDLLACTFPCKCKLPQCVCMKNVLKCTEMFTLQCCDNWVKDTESDT